jgi:hypothetical protein
MNRLLELPLSEIRPELDRNTSNAGMLQSGMLHLMVGGKPHRWLERKRRGCRSVDFHVTIVGLPPVCD